LSHYVYFIECDLVFTICFFFVFFFFQAEDGIRDYKVTGVQTCALPISVRARGRALGLPAETHGDLVRCLFHLGLSTRDAVTEERSEERRVGKECRARGWA